MNEFNEKVPLIYEVKFKVGVRKRQMINVSY